MSNIPIVHGTPVSVNPGLYEPSSPHSKVNHTSSPSNVSHAYQQTSGGEYTALGPNELVEIRQNPLRQYQDVVWAIAFWIHLVVIMVVILIGLQSADGISSASYGGIMFMVGLTGLTAVGLSVATLTFMMNHTETLVQTALIFSVVSSLIVALVGFMVGSLLMGILGILSFLVGICYAKIVWPRIPFAAANLQTAVTAVQQNMGLTAVAMGFTGLAFVWTLLWFLGLGDALAGSKLPVVFLLFLSYYWVHQVLQNTMHVTTAGVTATWWYIPQEASAWWSQALTDSLVRATTYSFGSICFGSFLVALVQALRAIEHYTRDDRDMGIVHCVVQCILACIQSIIEYMNKWAYVYVGMYGFSYLDAGRNVIQLFQNKGWTVVITEDLGDNVLSMMSVAIGLASGLVGLILGVMNPNLLLGLGFESVHGPAFFVGFLSGLLFSAVLLSVVSSAINTVIVCYAEDPAAFESNHPQLSSNMRQAWVQAFPGVIA